MRKIYNYIMIAVFAFAAISCIDEIGNTDIPTAETGDEVQFGLSLPDAKTRTVYGDEANNAFPIYWVNEDKVQIFSPQCLEGRRSAEYKVAVDGSEQNYATSLTKTGAYGVQWGDEETADFYSLYPSGNYTLSEYEDEDGNVLPCAAGITINYSQNILVDGDDVKSDMEDCLMYAKTTGVTRGETVNLHYDPISTVFMVTLNVPDSSADDFTIQSISLITDEEHIAGTFRLDIADGSFAGWADNSSSTVTAQIYDKSTGGYYTLTKDNSVQIPLFLAPVEGLNTDGWQIKVVANNKEYLKTLSSQDIVAGQIHKVTLPNLSTAKEDEEWDVSKWMTYIPRNVYLSEVSIPGSWNSLNPEFQGSSPTISGQYAKGARAFHLDTRWQGGGSALRPTVSDVLGVADGGNTVEYQNNARVMTDSDNPSVEDALDEMIENISDDEYMLLICTFAQGSYNHSYTSNGVTYDWVGEISRICSEKTDVYDAKALTSNTLIGDVLGKVIVIVNTEGTLSATPKDSKCLFVDIPLTLTSSLFGGTLDNNIKGINKGTAESTTIADSGIDMYNTQAQVCIEGETYTDSRDRSNVDGRGFAPTFGERKNVANNILTWSRNNYGTDNYAHDKWIYLGLGGYYVYYYGGAIFGFGAGWKAKDNGHEGVAEDMNSWINGKVTEMGTTPSGQTTIVPYYPVGIVLMNYVINYEATAKNILTLNNKYRLQYDASKPSDYVGSNVDTGGNGGGILPD